jgi:ketosteroid isomerase-like protein
MFVSKLGPIGTLLLCLLVFTPSSGLAQDDDLKDKLAAFDESFVAAWISGDADALAARFTEDALYWPPEGETLRGREEIKAFLAKLGKTESLEIEPLWSERIGDHVLLFGNFVQGITLRGQPIVYRGGFMQCSPTHRRV